MDRKEATSLYAQLREAQAEVARLREALKRLNDAVCDFESEGNSISGDMLTASMEAIVLMRCLAELHSVTPAVANGDSSKQPCGHPVACIVSSDEGTAHCAWCEEVAQARAAGVAEERERWAKFAWVKFSNAQEECIGCGAWRVFGTQGEHKDFCPFATTRSEGDEK